MIKHLTRLKKVFDSKLAEFMIDLTILGIAVSAIVLAVLVFASLLVGIVFEY
jgi:hypothetical protein